MLNFLEWLKLNESMSLYISGHDYHGDINNLDDLAHQIKVKLINPIWYKLSPEDQQMIQKGGSMYHGIITPDGSHYLDGEQVLNFYTQGWKDVSKIIQGIKYYLDELHVKYGPFKEEKSGAFNGNVIRIPILEFKKTNNSPPLLNMSNANAELIFHDLLGFDTEQHMSPVDVYHKIETLNKDQLDIHARDAYQTQNKGSAQVFHGGLSSSDIANRLEQIKKIAKWAIDNHYDQMYLA